MASLFCLNRGGNKMTTNDLMAKLREMDLILCFNSVTHLLEIFDSTENGRLAGVDTTDEYIFDLCGMEIKHFEKERRAKLAQILYEYATTPVEKRENEKGV